MQHEKIHFTGYLSISMMSFICLGAVIWISFYGFFAHIMYFIAAVLFLLPLGISTAQLSSTWKDNAGIFTWPTKAYNVYIGNFTVFAHWLQNTFLINVLLIVCAVFSSYLIMPDTNSALSMAGNKYYIVSFNIVTFWLLSLVNMKGVKVTSKICIVGVIGGILIPFFILTITAFYTIYTTGFPWNNFSIYQPFEKIFSFSDIKLFIIIIGSFFGIEITSVFSNNFNNNKKKGIRRAILIPVAATPFIFLLCGLFITIIIPDLKHISTKEDLLFIINSFFNTLPYPSIYKMLSFCFILGAVANISVWISGPNKTLHYSCIRGKLPKWLIKVNEKGVPERIYIVQGLLITVLSLFFALQQTVGNVFLMMQAFFVILSLIVYIILFSSTITLSIRYEYIKNFFIIPFGKNCIYILYFIGIITSLFTILICVYFPLSQSIKTHYDVYLNFITVGVLSTVIASLLIYSETLKNLVFKSTDISVEKNIKLLLILCAATFLTSLVRFLCNLILARNMLISAYGDLSLTIRIIAIVSLVLLLGTNLSAVKYLSYYFETGNIFSINRFVRWNYRLVFKNISLYIFLLCIVYLIIMTVDLGKIVLEVNSYKYTLFFLTLVPLVVISNLLSSYFLSYKWPVLYYFFNSMAKQFIFLMLLGISVLYFNTELGLINILVLFIFTYLIMIFFEFFFITRIFQEYNIRLPKIFFLWKEKSNISDSESRIWKKESLKLIINRLIYYLNLSTGFFVLEIFHPDEKSLGFFAVIIAITNVIILIPTSIKSIILPKIKYLTTKKKHTELQQNIDQLNIINFLILTVLLIIILFFGNEILATFGVGYKESYLPLIIIGTAYYISGLLIPIVNVLIFTDTRKIITINVIQIFILITIGIFGTYYFYLSGMAFAILISSIIKSLLIYLSIKKSLPIRPLSII
ncbi:MAG: amino acid permease [Victivallales bacterium]|nr:amino acid permease [Victivallales bacterium]